MPRATTVECPGCPPLRALTFDTLGLIKGIIIISYFQFASTFSYSFFFLFLVIESREKQQGCPKIVDKWGQPDSTKSVNAVSLIDRQSNPVRFLSLQSLSLLV